MQPKTPTFQLYPWQQTIWRHLQDYVEQQRLPQALLLTGSAGFGQRHLAELFAALLTCSNPQNLMPCGECATCKLQLAQTHPDVFNIAPDEAGKAIGIDKIRDLITSLTLKPQYPQSRLVLIQPADALNANSANAFLKILEEPTERTCFILISDQPTKLPATIRSRCQKIFCATPDFKQASAWLSTQGIIDQQTQLLNLAQGAPILAKTYAEQNILQVRQQIFLDWFQVAEGKTNVLAVAEQWQKFDQDLLTALFAWLSSCLIDIIKLANAAEVTMLNNADFASRLQPLANTLRLAEIYSYYDQLLLSRQLLSTTANKQLLLEHLLIQWQRLHQRH